MRFFLLLFFLLSEAWAGMIFLPGKMKGDAFKAGKIKAPIFQINYSHIKAEINEEGAQLRVEELLEGEGQAVGLLPLPKGAKEISLLLDGAPLKGELLKGKAAEARLSTLAEGSQNARLLVFMGRDLFFIPKVKLGARQELLLKIEMDLQEGEGLSHLELPMPAPSFARAPVQRLRLSAQLKGKLPVRAVFSPSHPIQLKRPQPNRVEISLLQERLIADTPLSLYFAIDKDALGLRLLSHRAPKEELGYFLLLGNPSGGAESAEAKDLILVLDSSGSMRGEKWEQARSALEYVLMHLNPGDRFKLLTFGTEVKSASKKLLQSNKKNQEVALRFLEDVVPLGRTNLFEALSLGLAGKESPRPRIMILLTDGSPTAGEMDPKKILKALPKLNRSKTRIFALGIGDDVNPRLLDRFAQDTGGSSLYVGEEDLDIQVAALYDRLSNPTLSDLKLDWGGAEVQDLHPKLPRSLFQGTDLMLFGRYKKGGDYKVKLSGKLKGQSKSHEVLGHFPSTAKPQNEFIAPLWASRRIGTLLRRIRLEGQDEALLTEIVDLSRRFGIITEYTRFMADEGISGEEAQRRAGNLIQGANAQFAGKWAVQQSLNESSLSNRMFNSDDNNLYRDRKGQKKSASKTRIIGRRAYYKRKGRWIQAEDGKKRKKRRVKRFSAEYKKLIKKNADFSKAQTLDGDMTIDLEDERIEVY